MRAKWLYDKHPITIDKDLATVIGLNESIVLQQLNYWLHSKIAKKVNGRYWIYNTYQKWHDDNFPFLSISSIRRAFGKLEKEKIVITNNFNRAGFDKTKWYTIDEERLDEVMSSASVQNEQTECSNWTDGGVQNEQTYTREYTENTTENTNIYSSPDKQDEPHAPKPPKSKSDEQDYSQIYKDVIDYLNQKTGAHYKPSSKVNQRLIKSRAKEGYSLDDFKRVIDNKSFGWQNTDMWKYMRPSTLFGSKFDDYLNENDLKQHQTQPTSGGYSTNVSFVDMPDDDDLPF